MPHWLIWWHVGLLIVAVLWMIYYIPKVDREVNRGFKRVTKEEYLSLFNTDEKPNSSNPSPVKSKAHLRIVK